MSCAIWNKTAVLWSNANWRWSECSGSAPTPPTPIVDLSKLGVDATTLIQPWIEEPWNPYRAGETKKKPIKLICKVGGKTYDDEKSSKKLEMSVNEVKLKQSVIGIDLDVKKL